MVVIQSPKKIYSDNAPELVKACSELEYPHDTNTPHRPQSNDVCERCVRKVKEGTKWALFQSGLHPLWWGAGQCVVTASCLALLRNVFLKGAVLV